MKLVTLGFIPVRQSVVLTINALHGCVAAERSFKNPHLLACGANSIDTSTANPTAKSVRLIVGLPLFGWFCPMRFDWRAGKQNSLRETLADNDEFQWLCYAVLLCKSPLVLCC